MSQFEREVWINSFHRGMDMWLLLDRRPKVYNKDGEECRSVFEYCRHFANACLEEFRSATGYK